MEAQSLLVVAQGILCESHIVALRRPHRSSASSRSPTLFASGALISKGKVPSRLKAAMNMRIALEGVVPICSVASKNRSFSCGDTLATIGVILSATVAPVVRFCRV